MRTVQTRRAAVRAQESGASRMRYRKTRIIGQQTRARKISKTKQSSSHLLHLSTTYPVPVSASATTSKLKMTVLTDNETQELQRKIERLTNALVTPAQCNEWSQHFRIDTDLQGIKALLSQKRSHLLYSSLPEWQQNEMLASIAQVESYVMRMEVNHNRQVANEG